MGLRGPIRDPNSRRGRQEAARRAKLALVSSGTAKPEPVKPAATKPKRAADQPQHPGAPTCPEWLSEDQAALFCELVDDLQAAQVPIKHIDSHAIMMAVQCLSGVREAAEISQDGEVQADQRLVALRLKAQLGKDLIQWLQLICATPGARARIGLRSTPEKKMGPLGQILAAKRRLQ